MAVDLTPRFRRLNSETRCFRENRQPAGVTGPFRATQLWRNIIGALQTQVEVKRHRQHLRVHRECFTGSDAVDVVLSHLMQNIYFCSSEVSRLKAARLCQALMDARVFEPVGMKLFRREKEMAFEDSGCSLYRFVDCDALPGSAKSSGDVENVTPVKQNGKKKKWSRFEDVRTISNPLAHGSSDRRVERILQTINLQPSVPSGLNHAGLSTSCLSKTVVQEVWKQQTLLQLLQLVELPMLDCILTSPAKPESLRMPLHRNHDDLIISNTCVDREVSQVLNLPELDSWLMAAADCLELFPDQLIVATGEQLVHDTSSEGEERLRVQKRILFDTIAKYYSSQERMPLLAGRYMDIHTGILKLLDCGRGEDALRASQLCLRLLDASSRDELRRLLAFMAEAGDSKAFKLHKQIENRALVSRMFVKAVLQGKDVARVQCEQLLLFLMDNHLHLFKTPVSLIETVRKALQTLQQGRDPDNVALFAFCQQVSVKKYKEQREKTTSDSLKQLIDHITLNNKLSTKERRRLIKEFQKHHPAVFLQHFSSTF
ncbi:DEP domain-containing protein 4 [Astyanax mexicanus]|uniref:DEP domain-containing protein 4 n=1 Tax=Astyanax mexicanus TaxID=7994 RepID=UPI0020CABF54|nr:DEP domain-containing protein 4 [Astyanax mexicanus]